MIAWLNELYGTEKRLSKVEEAEGRLEKARANVLVEGGGEWRRWKESCKG